MIALAGISHATAPVALRERLAVSEEELPRVLDVLRERYGAAVVLSTCNRTELYLSRALPPARLRAALRSLKPSGARVPDTAIYVLAEADAARHLLRVASGLDSLLLGEDQILGQVRRALGAAAAAGTTDRLLSRLFHLAIATGRRVRTETAIGRHARSVSAAAVHAVARRLGPLDGRTLLVVGAGAAGKLSALALREARAGRLLVASRTYVHAAEVATEAGGEAVPLGELPRALAEADAVILAASGGGPLLTPETLAAVSISPARPLLIVDIAVPRAVDPAVAVLPGVQVIDIDALGGEAPDAPALGALADAEAIVDEELARLEAWWESLRVVPTITALRGRAEAVRRAELARTLPRLSNLSPRDRERIEALTAAIVNKLLHEPIQQLKRPGVGVQYAALVHDLFALPGERPVQPFPSKRQAGFPDPEPLPWPPIPAGLDDDAADPAEAAR